MSLASLCFGGSEVDKKFVYDLSQEVDAAYAHLFTSFQCQVRQLQVLDNALIPESDEYARVRQQL